MIFEVVNVSRSFSASMNLKMDGMPYASSGLSSQECESGRRAGISLYEWSKNFRENFPRDIANFYPN